jgi:hypothetical protein
MLVAHSWSGGIKAEHLAVILNNASKNLLQAGES